MDLKEELGRVMRQYVDKNIVAGVNLLVEKDGQEICYCQAGLADRENGKKLHGIRFSDYILRQSR